MLRRSIDKGTLIKASFNSTKVKLLQLVEELVLKKKITSKEALENILAVFLLLLDKIEDPQFLYAVLLLIKILIVVGLAVF